MRRLPLRRKGQARAPVCASGPTHFHPVDAGDHASRRQRGHLNLSEVYDGRELHWTDEAKTFPDSLEEWQEKRRVRARVEKSALEKGYTTITREYVEQQYREERPAARPRGCGRRLPRLPRQAAGRADERRQVVRSTTPPSRRPVLWSRGWLKEFAWTQEAIDRLERAPKGFMRNISRNMTEKLARERGVTT